MRLRLAQRDPDLHRDVEVRLPVGSTIADLLAALGAPEAAMLTTSGGDRLARERPLHGAGLVDGDAVATDPSVRLRDPATILCPITAGAGVLTVTGGPDAGRRIVIPRGGGRLGRGPGAELPIADPTVGRLHAELRPLPDGTVRLHDLGTTNGSRLTGRPVTGPAIASPGDVLRFGTTRCRLDASAPVAVAGGADGRAVTVHRPGRRSRPEPPVPLPAPPRRQDGPATATAPGIAAIGVPLLVGLLLGWLFSPMLALFALLGPAVAGGQWLDDRRRHRRARRDADRAFTDDLAGFQHELERWRAHELDRLREESPDVATLTGRLVATDRRCWSRTAADGDVLRLRLGAGPGDLEAGVGDVDTRPPPVLPTGSEPEVAGLLHDARRSDDLPVTCDLPSDGDLAVAGPAEVVRGILRAVVLQAAILAPPSELAVAVVTDRPERWRDAAWLPHTRAGGTTLVVGLDAGGGPPTLDAGRLTGTGRSVLLVVDADRPPRIATDRDPTIHTITRASTAGDAPRTCCQVLEVSAASVGTLRALDRHDERRLVVDGVGQEVFGAAARVLARWRDGTTDEAADGIDLADVIAPAGLSPAAVVRRWERHDHRLATPLGRDAGGPVVLDLSAEGPHALVAGTTGAGKSELLRSLVLGLALSCPPDRLTFLLFDFKGGSAFDACTRLPHTTEVVTDLDGRGAARALTCLQAEVRRRERLLRRSGDRDHGEHVRRGGDLPALAIVVDEFAVLAEEHPDVLGSLVDVARRGRSLGIHLVLATQRPSGVVTPEIRANTAVRICLRVEDPAEARDVVADARPARFARTATGLALLRVGGREAVEFRAACAGLEAVRPGIAPLWPDPDQPGTDPPAPDPAEIVRTCREAAASLRLRSAPSPVPPALPDQLSPGELPRGDGTVAVGLVDRPGRQARQPLLWELDRGALIGVGLDAWRVPRAAGAAVAAGPRDTHLQVLACGSALDDLSDQPHTGSVVRPGEWDRLERLLRHLTGQDRRRRTVLLIDDLPGVLRRLDDPRDLALRSAVEALVVGGHDHGVHVAAGVPGGAAVPIHLLGAGTLLLAGAGVDRHDATALGIGRVPGTAARFTTGPDGDETVLVDGLPAAGLLAAETGHEQPFRSPATPDRVALGDVLPDADLSADPWLLPVGLGHGDLTPARLPLRAGGGAVVAGPARSGRSSLLGVVAAAVRRHRPEVTVTLLTPGPSTVPGIATGEHAGTPAAAVERCRRPGDHLLLVDDAERLADGPDLLALLERRLPRLRILAAGRADRLRTAHVGWLAELRRERCGVALSPDTLADGPIWDTVLPRRVARGPGPAPAELVVDGTATRLLPAWP